MANFGYQISQCDNSEKVRAPDGRKKESELQVNISRKSYERHTRKNCP